MVLTTSELIQSLQHEVHILLHLAGKVDAAHLDYRPTPKQRSVIELLRYMSFMGPTLIRAVNGSGFDPAEWTTQEKAANARDLEQTKAAIAAQSGFFAHAFGAMSDADFRQEVDMFGNRRSRGAFIVNVVLGGYAAYRTQLFLYLKACGRTELSTMNLWAGVDPPAPR